MSARIRIWALAACLIGLVFVSASGFAQREKCVVDPPELHWVVDRPGEDMAPVTVGVYRNPGAGSGAIRFRMTNLVSENGHVLPPDCIGSTRLHRSLAEFCQPERSSGFTGLRTNVQRDFGPLVSICLGAGGNLPGIFGKCQWRCRNTADSRDPRRARLVVEPSKISITAGLGPGTYRTNEKSALLWMPTTPTGQYPRVQMGLNM